MPYFPRQSIFCNTVLIHDNNDVKSWRNNWEELTVFYEFPLEILKNNLYHQPDREPEREDMKVH